MKNKRLENRLKDGKYLDIINLIEKCEDGIIEEINIDEKEVIISDKTLNVKVVKYLEKLNIKLNYVDASKYRETKNHFYKPKKVCEGIAHKIVDGEVSKESKLGQLHYDGIMTFSVDETSYVACLECNDILPVK